MKSRRIIRIIAALVVLAGLVCAGAMVIQNPNQGNTVTTQTTNPDSSVTVTTVTTYKDGSTTTTTTYDKDGHDAGTTRTDVQTKDGETTTTTTKYDGSGHETGRTIERADKNGNKTTYDGQGHETGKTIERVENDGSRTIISYDGQGHETGRKTVPKPDASVQSSVQGIVLPDNVHEKQPFTFAVPDTPAQSQINIQTVNGVVVDSGHPDKQGRIFIAAGLAAGSYLISSVNRDGRKTEVGKVEVKPSPADALQRSWEHPPQQVQILNPPRSMKVGDPLWLSGHGFSPNGTNMQASVFSSGQTYPVPVLAATEDQLKLAPITNVRPGPAELKITNGATNQSAPSQPLFFYDLQGHLQQEKLHSGQHTSFVLESQPKTVPMRVHATIFGKASFKGGHTDLDTMMERGRLTVPVEANKGSGDFHIDFEGQPEGLPLHAACGCGCGGSTQPACAHKGCSCANAAVSATHPGNMATASCSCGCGGTAQPACAHKGCVCSKTSAVSTGATRLHAGCSCGCGGTPQPACAHKGCECSKTSAGTETTTQLPSSLPAHLENVSTQTTTTGKAGCSCGCGGTAQPRCAHKACGCSK